MIVCIDNDTFGVQLPYVKVWLNEVPKLFIHSVEVGKFAPMSKRLREIPGPTRVGPVSSITAFHNVR